MVIKSLLPRSAVPSLYIDYPSGFLLWGDYILILIMDNPYVCNICSWSTSRKSSYTKHCSKHKTEDNNAELEDNAEDNLRLRPPGDNAENNNNVNNNVNNYLKDIYKKTNTAQNPKIANADTQIKLGNYLLLVLQKFKQIENVLDAQDAKIKRIITTVELIREQNNNILKCLETRKCSNPFVVKLDN